MDKKQTTGWMKPVNRKNEPIALTYSLRTYPYGMKRVGQRGFPYAKKNEIKREGC